MGLNGAYIQPSYNHLNQSTAYDIRDRLADEFEAASDCGKIKDFPKLYFCTTTRWLQYADNCQNPAIMYLLVEEFYENYKSYVLDLHANETFAAEHWIYHIYCHRFSGGSLGSVFRIFALLFGIRAHIRHDLAEAIHMAVLRYRERFGTKPDLDAFRSMIYGAESDRIFLMACLDFAELNITNAKHKSHFKWLARLVAPLWLSLFQSGRKAAWQEAIQSLETGKPIERKKIKLKFTSHEQN